MEKVLTICIPTYNRATKLDECLTRIFSLEKCEEIDVVISDNASSDNTQEIADKWTKKYSNVSYFRHPQNMGMDINFHSALLRANTKYAMLLSDDDKLPEGFLVYFLPILKKNEYSFIKIGHYAELKRVKTYSPEEYSDFLNDIGIYCTYISTMIFNRRVIGENEEAKKFYGSLIVQTKLMIDSISNSGLPILLDESYTVITTPNDHVNYSISHVFIYSLSKILKSNKKISKKVRKQMMKASLEFYFMWVKHYKKMGYKLLLHFKDLLIILSHFYGWTHILPVLLIPSFLVKKRK